MSEIDSLVEDEEIQALKRVIAAPTATFSLLVEQAGLNPATDFQYLNLSGCDFNASNLRGFNFKGADLSRTDWTLATYDSSTIVEGACIDNVIGLDQTKFLSKARRTRRSKETNWQKTLGDDVTLTGIGVHSGLPVTLNLKPSDTNSGIVFIRTGREGIPDREVRANLPYSTSNDITTVLGDVSGPLVSTAEHVLAALAGLGIDNAVVEIDGPEAPVMDGSAEPFVAAIDQAGIVEQSVSRRYLRVLKPVSVKKGDSFAEIRPYEHGFRVEVEISFNHVLIGKQSIALDVTPDSFRRELARARTFGFMRDVAKLWSAGYALGASFDNTLVVTENRVLNPDGARFDDEFVRHKALDVIGDLVLAGAPILGAFRSINGGHKINHQLLSALIADRSSWTIVGGKRDSKSNRAEASLRVRNV